MHNAIVEEMIQEMTFSSRNSEEVFKFHATLLIEDFSIPAGYVVDMMHSLKAAISVSDAYSSQA